MKKKLLVSLAIIVFLSFGSSLMGDPIDPTYGLDNLTWIGISYQTPESAALAELGYSSLTYQGKWDGVDGEGWAIETGWAGTVESDPGQYTQAMFVWNGTGTITHIVLKADGYYALFALKIALNPGESQVVSSDPSLYPPESGDVDLGLNSNNKPYSISHITGYGTKSVPEPATLVLLGLGLMAVPVAKKFKF